MLYDRLMILGIDEVGRGPWAGPLVVGAVVLGGAEIIGLTDSKKLTKSACVRLEVKIREKAAGIGLGWVSANEIDEIGLSQALVLATKRAVEQIKTPYSEIIIDGTVNFLKETKKGKYVTTMKKADLLVPCVSAASIVAKVARDNYMSEQDIIYPGYGFKQHVGYGTAAHVAAINKLGVTPLHRLSFAPLAKYRRAMGSGTDFVPRHLQPKRYKAPGPLKCLARSRFGQDRCLSPEPTTKQIGDMGEDKATEYLVRLGHEILDRNWKTKYCEIDIVSQKSGTLYFTEVKYRKNANFGGGLQAITKKKLNQMKFAVKFYAAKNKITDTKLLLTAMELVGDPPEVTEFVEV